MGQEQTKIIFFGTGSFGLPILKALVQNGYQVLTVVTSPDKLQGRSKKLSFNTIKQYALDNNIPLLQPESLKKNGDILETISNLKTDLGIVVAYGKLLPQEILDLPKHKTLNIHPSLLPLYRGPSPIQNALLNGDQITGTSIMVIDAQMDHGPLIAQQEIRIDTNDTYTTLSEKLVQLSSQLLLEILPHYLSGHSTLIQQDDSKATYTAMLELKDAEITKDDSLVTAYNKIRAFNPEPGAFVVLPDGLHLKILNCTRVETHYNASLQETQTHTLRLYVKDTKLFLALKDGSLELLRVQPAGRKPMSAIDFINGLK